MKQHIEMNVNIQFWKNLILNISFYILKYLTFDCLLWFRSFLKLPIEIMGVFFSGESFEKNVTWAKSLQLNVYEKETTEYFKGTDPQKCKFCH